MKLRGVPFAIGLLAAACGDSGPSAPAVCEGPTEPGPSPIRRLTRVEYDNTIFQLLGDNRRPARGFVADEEALGFNNQASALVASPLLTEQYMNAAEVLAAAHAEELLAGAPACAAPAPDAAGCRAEAQGLITTFGKRAFRRPLEAAEVERYAALFDQGAALGDGAFDPRAGLGLVVQALLQSPHFLYRVELGHPEAAPGQVVELTSYEMASRLSYLFWNSMPDEALLAAADRDELRTPEQIETWARRLLAAPRARDAVRNFHRQWLGLDEIPMIAANGKDADIYPQYYEGLLPLMQEEIEAFLEVAIFDSGASLGELLTADWTMMNEELAAFYGVVGPQGTLFEPVSVDPSFAAGVLSRAGLMALYAKPDRSSPIHRGKFVRERLLCQEPPPPPDVQIEPPNVDPTKTTREQLAEHESNSVCAGCHLLMDPIGFAFEHYDGLGLWRDTEWGLPIDATGQIVGGGDADGTFDGAAELANRLAGSQQVSDCVTTQWFRFASGRSETELDACSLATVRARFAASGNDIKELLVALTQTPAFRYRRVAGPEANP